MHFFKLPEGKFYIIIIFKTINFSKVLVFSKIENCYFSINKLVNSGMSQEDAWNQTTIKLTKAAEVILVLFFIINYLI